MIALSTRAILTLNYCAPRSNIEDLRVFVGPEHPAPHNRDTGCRVDDVISVEDGLGLVLVVLAPGFALAEDNPDQIAAGGHPTIALDEPVRFVGYGNTVATDNDTGGYRMMSTGVIPRRSKTTSFFRPWASAMGTEAVRCSTVTMSCSEWVRAWGRGTVLERAFLRGSIEYTMLSRGRWMRSEVRFPSRRHRRASQGSTPTVMARLTTRRVTA